MEIVILFHLFSAVMFDIISKQIGKFYRKQYQR